MSAPNRSDVVKRVVAENAHAVNVTEAELEDRRRRFLPVIIAAMPAEDRPQWGVLLKTDKHPNVIPSDILVWRPTMEHIDCLTADDASGGGMVIVPLWKNHGAIGVAPGTQGKVGKWIWLDAMAANIPPLPAKQTDDGPTDPNKPPAEDEVDTWERELVALLENLVRAVEGIRVAAETLAVAAKRFT
jgi:hypothetical protein